MKRLGMRFCRSATEHRQLPVVLVLHCQRLIAQSIVHAAATLAAKHPSRIVRSLMMFCRLLGSATFSKRLGMMLCRLLGSVTFSKRLGEVLADEHAIKACSRVANLCGKVLLLVWLGMMLCRLLGSAAFSMSYRISEMASPNALTAAKGSAKQ